MPRRLDHLNVARRPKEFVDRRVHVYDAEGRLLRVMDPPVHTAKDAKERRQPRGAGCDPDPQKHAERLAAAKEYARRWNVSDAGRAAKARYKARQKSQPTM